jgi:hypothetical protein
MFFEITGFSVPKNVFLAAAKRISQRKTGPQKRRYPYSNKHDSDARITNHYHAKRPKRSDCIAYKEGTF